MKHSVVDGIGIEITDFTLPELLSASGHDEIRSIFQRSHLLVFRGSNITPEEQIALCSIIGAPVDEALDDRFYTTFTNDGSSEAGTGKLPFHSDNSFSPTPLSAISLYALEIPAKGTSTLFRDTELAWEKLAESQRRNLETKSALHMLDEQSPDRHRVAGYKRHATAEDPQAEHRIGFLNPNNRRMCLYVNEELTEYVVGVSRRDSDEILEDLLSHISVASPIYEHSWHKNDLVVWDNLALQHARSDGAMADEGPDNSRTFRRVAVTRPEWKARSDSWYEERAVRRAARPLVRSR